MVNAYIGANKALYEINRRMYLDVDAAKVLGMNEDDLQTNFDNRGESRNFNFLNEGLFKPYVPSRDVQELFIKRAEELGAPNPFEQAVDVMDRIRDILESVPLNADVFPNIENPFSNLPEPTLGAAASLPGLPPMPNPALVNNAQFGNIDPVSRLTLAEETYLSPLEQSYRKKQRTT